MQRRQRLAPVPHKQRKVEIIGVEVDDVELVSALRQTMQRNEMIGAAGPCIGYRGVTPVRKEPAALPWSLSRRWRTR